MATILLANVGDRDVSLDGDRVRRPREEGEALLKQWPRVAERLSLPILKPVLRHLEGRGQKPDHIVLFATDQPAGTAEELRSKDTLYLAELAKRMIESWPGYGGRAMVRKVAGLNPSLYDEMFQYFGHVLGNRNDKALRDVSQCYVSPVGGTPAANAGLLLAAVDRFGKNCTVLYLREGTDTPVRLNAGRMLYENTLRQVIAHQIESYQFAPSLPLMQDLGPSQETCCLALAEYCLRRLNFDFEAALRVAEDAYAGADPAARPLLEMAAGEARKLHDGSDASALLVELAHNLDVTYESGAYMDCLARAVRFEESAARFLVEQYLPPLDYGSNDLASQERRRQQIEETPDLRQLLGERSEGGQPLRYWESNTRVLLALADYVAEARPNRPSRWHIPAERQRELAEAVGVLHRLENLNRARNRSVHHYGGASAESIKEWYCPASDVENVRSRDLRADIWRVVEVLTEQHPSEWLIDRIRDWIVERLWA